MSSSLEHRIIKTHTLAQLQHTNQFLSLAGQHQVTGYWELCISPTPAAASFMLPEQDRKQQVPVVRLRQKPELLLQSAC